ncbi:TetR/AcrR family transcriptional regulator [Methylobacterium nodulans]|uniref:Regulatory protein TetR n=1 Tax=Methylobacterium nodulans (strain LMG 21967 / CNCM I-2342 / ORS 2060) TaxID=460265 RepID=B8IVB9_METNO|nr:TetR family transcriptional regulator [Methylobacterium nodulans]ACL60970.1 regulatory protein TetR [Methylobacterium nodulans ORS 2060]
MNEDATADRVLDAYLALMADRPFDRVSMRMVAEAAGISLAQLRATFASEEALLESFAARVDGAMLDRVDAHPWADDPRARIVTAMLARFEVLAPLKPAIRSLLTGAADPATALFFGRVSVEEHRWTLIAAGLNHRGPRARNLAEAVSLAFVTAAAAWLDDVDVALHRTRTAIEQAFAYDSAALATFDTFDRTESLPSGR